MPPKRRDARWQSSHWILLDVQRPMLSTVTLCYTITVFMNGFIARKNNALEVLVVKEGLISSNSGNLTVMPYGMGYAALAYPELMRENYSSIAT